MPRWAAFSTTGIYLSSIFLLSYQTISQDMTVVEKAVLIGIVRSTSNEKTEK